MAYVAPSLDSKGWITDPNEYLVRLFTYYVASNYSQSLLFKGNILSMQKAIQQFGPNMEGLASRMQSDLTSIFGRSFGGDNVMVEVVVDESTGDWQQTAKINLLISATVKYRGTNYELRKSIANTDSIFTKFTNAVGIS